MRGDRYAEFGLTDADTPFYRAIRDGFRASRLSRAQLNDALTWYRDHVRPGMDETALHVSFSDFATNRGWAPEELVAATSVRAAIQERGPEAIIVVPTAEEDAATISRANEAMRTDINGYFKDIELQEAMAEALERQEAVQATPKVGPPVTDTEIERRAGLRNAEKIERILREDPQRYWGDPRLQADFRTAIERAALLDEAPAGATPTEPAPAAPAAPVERAP
jgi:hypothetical protein